MRQRKVYWHPTGRVARRLTTRSSTVRLMRFLVTCISGQIATAADPHTGQCRVSSVAYCTGFTLLNSHHWQTCTVFLNIPTGDSSMTDDSGRLRIWLRGMIILMAACLAGRTDAAPTAQLEQGQRAALLCAEELPMHAKLARDDLVQFLQKSLGSDRASLPGHNQVGSSG